MHTRFIVLIDFSEYSGNLIRYAFDWSKKANAELLLVHQTTVIAPALTDNHTKQEMAEQANDEALQKLQELAKEIIPPPFQVSFSVSESHLQLTLARLLAGPFENIIFTGVKGTGILKKLFLGSMALQIIDSTNNIVVAMPQEVARFSHEKIFVAVTEKYPLNLLELNKFLNFIDRTNTTLTFFFLAKPYEKTKAIEKYLKDVSEMFADRYHTNTVIYEGNHPFADIKKVINNKFDEILVVQKGSRLLTDQLFRKFLINELVYEGQTPLVILP
jgi:nucleotide-binding universal stress UspA family protein